jgi:formylmethanofuran dehydrogenase subunit C
VQAADHSAQISVLEQNLNKAITDIATVTQQAKDADHSKISTIEADVVRV